MKEADATDVHDTLEEVLQGCLDGDDDAVAELVRRFQPWALELAKALLNDEELGRDAVQEAFVVALQQLGDLRELAAFPGWFRQIIRTQAARIARKRHEVFGPEPNNLAVDPETPRRNLERGELRERVREAIRRLARTDGRTAELYYLEGRSCREVAQLLDVPTGTVKRRLHDARKRLRSILLGNLAEEPAAAEPAREEGKQKGRIPL